MVRRRVSVWDFIILSVNLLTRPTLEKQGALAILLAMTAAVAVMSWYGNLFPAAARWLLAGAGIQSLIVFVGLAWALHRSDAIFYTIFVGDAVLRFVILGLSLLLLDYWRIPLMTPLVSLAMGYLFFSIIQIPFLHRMPL